MVKLLAVFSTLIFSYYTSLAQPDTPAAQKWVDSVFNSLSDDQRISQLMVLRVSEITANGVVFYEEKITEAIRKYNIGGIVLFQGGPVKQARLVNSFQKISKTPLLVCVDAEWGLGMRFDSIIPLNHQLMLGAVEDASIIYQYGRLVGEQCKRAGIQVNFAPVVDINNNPNNPVINDRSFGEDKDKVALFGIQYMRGLQDAGVMASAKHFPGHGDVAVDSHYDLPVISKTKEQLDSLELYPFREMIKAGTGSVMVAHLYIPAIDSTVNSATSISKNNVTGVLRNELGYKGLTFTDALDMRGIAKYYPGGEIAARSLIAGNDILCLPADVPESIAKIREAILMNELSWEEIYNRCRKVLTAKYKHGLSTPAPVNTDHITSDINSKVKDLKKLVAENAITLLENNEKVFFKLRPASKAGRIAYVGIGINGANTFAKRMKKDYDAELYFFDKKSDSAKALSVIQSIDKKYTSVIIGIHSYARYPANNFGIPRFAVDMVRQLQQKAASATFIFGNPYVIKNFCDAPNLVACYEDDDITQNAAADLLKGRISARGKLPVTVCGRYTYGSGLTVNRNKLPAANPGKVGLDLLKLSAIDSIANNAIANMAAPGCVVLVAKDGKVAFEKAYGKYDYNLADTVSVSTVYDLASITKICATTLAVMKLYDEGKIKLNKTLGEYLPWVRGSDKQNLIVEDILLHQAGLVAFIPFYKETMDSVQAPLKTIYSTKENDLFNVRVAENLYVRNDWRDTMYKRILQSTLGLPGKYIYSDNDFIFLGKIVEAVTGKSLDEYVKKTFYDPLGLTLTGFKPRARFTQRHIAPTENENHFRLQHLRGDVHDPGAAMFGGVAGHAGLFGSANDIAIIMQMLLNGGNYKGRRYISAKTIKLFSAYNSPVSRRGLGYDKPEKDNITKPEPYPCKLATPLTFGHTGFTGTCVWADPACNLIYVFLSNRVNNTSDNTGNLSKLNVRGNIQDAIYSSLR